MSSSPLLSADSCSSSSVLNPQSRYYERLKNEIEADYEDNYWPEDAIFMERNSRDFVPRVYRINENAEAICDALEVSSIGKAILLPSIMIDCKSWKQSSRYTIRSVAQHDQITTIAEIRMVGTVACSL